MATKHVFPGVYASVTDKSSAPSVTSRFRAGLIGVANKGPFDIPTPIKSLREYQRTFGDSSITDDNGQWKGQMAVAATFIADYSEGSVVVRVGHKYSAAPIGTASGIEGAQTVVVANAAQISVGQFVKIQLAGKKTTINAQVTGKSGTNLTLDTPLAGDYSSGGALIYSATNSNAASEAEVFLNAINYSTNNVADGGSSSAVATGNKNSYEIAVAVDLSPKTITIASSGTTATVTLTGHPFSTDDRIYISNALPAVLNGEFSVTRVDANSFTYTLPSSYTGAGSNLSSTQPMTAAALVAGDLIQVSQATKVTTIDAMVKEVIPTTSGSTIRLYTSAVSSSGYQAVSLQDRYTNGRVKKAIRGSDGKWTTTRVLHLLASSAGTWADSDGDSRGLLVRVSPGSNAGTKKITVFYNKELVESIDNLSVDPTSTNYYPTLINATSSYIKVYETGAGLGEGLLADVHPANTFNGWSSASGSGTINFGAFGYGTTVAGGANGEDPTNDDWVGALNSDTDLYTGIQAFQNDQNYNVNVLSAPGQTNIAIQQELTNVAEFINASAILDVDELIKPREYADWRNAEGLYTSRQKIVNWHAALFANWWTATDPFTGETRTLPPSIAALRCMARTFDRDKPWAVAAGEIRGFVDPAIELDYQTISSEAKTSSYASGVNILISQSGRIMVYGDNTLYNDTTSKLVELHVATLVNYIILNLGQLVRKFVFDPADEVLLGQLKMTVDGFMETVKRERGVEDFLAVIDDKNNSAEVRNRREAIIDLAIIPTSAATRIYLNITTHSSGAKLNQVSTESTQ